jgi:cystathionine beta-lyase/cystathionine gamma-synthase
MYDVPVVIDDTIGSFCNIDVTPVADLIMSSITKSLSGYANVGPSRCPYIYLIPSV